jgi:hypothetical protein
MPLLDVDKAMNDLTILYYTANKIPEYFMRNVQNDLVWTIQGEIPIISISQKPISFGSNICVGEIGASAYNVYVQILAGAYLVKTKYVACCEDDTLYSFEHFWSRPPDGVFYYNINRWILERYGMYRYRNRTTMCACIAPTELLIDTLEERFKKYPEDPKTGLPFGEPGRVEDRLRLSYRVRHYFRTDTPILTFNHGHGLSRPRKASELDTQQPELHPWGDAKALWRRIHG